MPFKSIRLAVVTLGLAAIAGNAGAATAIERCDQIGETSGSAVLGRALSPQPWRFDTVYHFGRGEEDHIELAPRHGGPGIDAIVCNIDADTVGSYEFSLAGDQSYRAAQIDRNRCDLLNDADRLTLRGGNWEACVWVRMR